MVYAKVELLSLPIQQYKLPIPAQESNTKLLENAIEREMPLDPVWNIALKQSIAEPFKFRLRQPLLQKCAPQLTFLLGRQSGQIHAGPALILRLLQDYITKGKCVIDPAQLLLLQEVGVLPLQRHSLHIIFSSRDIHSAV